MHESLNSDANNIKIRSELRKATRIVEVTSSDAILFRWLSNNDAK